MNSGATLSPCRQYRYMLARVWNADAGSVVFIGLNPSTADESADDPTIRRCVGFTKRWGYGGLVMMNLFAYRATRPLDMKRRGAAAIGPDNDAWLRSICLPAPMIIAAWGNDGLHMGRGQQVRELLRGAPLCVLHINESTGQPKHPLYMHGESVPMLWGDA